MAHVPVECGIVVSEASFKWAAIQPKQGTYTFAAADRLMSYAAAHRLAVRGHNLVWQDYNPDWLAATAHPANAERVLTDYIARVAGHFRGRLVHWDVVNEPLEPEDGNPLGLRDGPWLRALGPRYHRHRLPRLRRDRSARAALRQRIRARLRLARPGAEARRRCSNCWPISCIAAFRCRRSACRRIWRPASSELDQNLLAKFCADVASLGLKIAITEMDVRDNREPADIAARDAGVAAQGKAFLDAVLPNPAVLGVVTWGLSDQRTWLDQQWPRKDGLPQRPLPLDAEMSRKPLWSAIGAAFGAPG